MADPFAALDHAELIEDPYPHLVVENALPPELARTLLDEMPPLDVFVGGHAAGSNLRFALPSARALTNSRATPAWRKAVARCNDPYQSLLDALIRRFGSSIVGAYPDFVLRVGPLDALRAVPRGRPVRRRHEVGMDVQVVVNTPALIDGTSVRGPHLDAPNKLFSGLLYLRADDDDSAGADLELYAPATDVVLFDGANDTQPRYVRHVRTYPFKHNLLVLLLNTPSSLHGVTPRGRTTRPRYHLQIVAETAVPLFDLEREPLSTTTVKAQITSPVPGSILPGSTTTFVRDAGVDLGQYLLWVGSAPETYDVFAGWFHWYTPDTRIPMTVPTDGRTLYVRLWSVTMAGIYLHSDYTYAAGSQ